jgi:DNA polymerase-3 subunit gamma/tau
VEGSAVSTPRTATEAPASAASINPFAKNTEPASSTWDFTPAATAGAPVEARPVGSVTPITGRTEGALALAPDPIPAPSSLSPFSGSSVTTPVEPTTSQKLHVQPSGIVLADPPVAHVAADEGYDPSWETMAPPDADPEATEPASSPAPTGANSDAAQFQAAAVEALFETKKHNSAAEQLEETSWTIADGEVQIATTLSKPLMATIFRPDVEAIIKTALREKGLAGVRLVFQPATLNNKPKAPKKPRTGSAQAKALEHPTVQKAQSLFNAEVTNVFDLRKD